MSKFLKIVQAGLIKSEGIPNVYIRNISIDDNRIMVDLSMKDQLNRKRTGGTWISNRAIINSLKIKAILCFDSNVSKSIINKRINLAQNFNGPESTVEQIISAAGVDYSGPGSLFRAKDSEGRFTHDIPYHIEFYDQRITKENPTYLSCIVFPYFEEPRSESTSGRKRYRIGKISSDIIFKDSKLVDRTTVLYTKGNGIYVGDMHKMPNGSLMTGIRHSSSGGYLKPKTVGNSKIRDLRIFDRIGEIENISINSQNETERSQFSDLYLSKDRDNQVRFLFGIDCGQVYRKNARFGRLLDNSFVTSQLMSDMLINSIRVYRQRVDIEPRIDREEGTSKLIAESADYAPRKMAKNSTYEGETLIGTIQETNPHTTTSSRNMYRFFSVTDHAITDHTDGLYKYRIELKFREPTRIYMYRKMLQLRENYGALNIYSSVATTGGMNVRSNRFNQKFFDSDRGRKNRVIKASIRTYLESLTSLVDVPSEEQKQISRTLMNLTHPISGNVHGVSLLMNLIEELAEKFDLLLSEKAFLSEGEETHASSMAIASRDLAEFEVIKEYSRDDELYDAGEATNVGIDCLQGQQSNIVYRGLATVSTGQWNSRIADENKRYLNSSKTLQMATEKKNVQINVEENQNEFLSPRVIYMGDEILDLQGTKTDLDYLSFDAMLARRNETTRKNNRDAFYIKSENNEEMIVNEISHFLNERSITLLTSNEIKNINTQGSVMVGTNSELDASNYVGDKSFFADPDEEKTKFKEATKSFSKNKSYEQEVNKAFPVFSQITPGLILNEQNVGNESRAIMEKANSLNKTNEKLNLSNKKNIIDTMGNVKAVPNQILALSTLEKTSFNPENSNGFVRDFRNNAEFNIRYNTLQRVEVLTGFGKGIKDPVWEPLTNEMFKNIREGYLVRLIPYSNFDLGVGSVYDLPVYNQYFFLGTPRSSLSNIRGRSNITLSTNINYIYPEYLNSSLESLEPITRERKYVRRKQPATITPIAPTTVTATTTATAVTTTLTTPTTTTGMAGGATTGGGGY